MGQRFHNENDDFAGRFGGCGRSRPSECSRRPRHHRTQSRLEHFQTLVQLQLQKRRWYPDRSQRRAETSRRRFGEGWNRFFWILLLSQLRWPSDHRNWVADEKGYRASTTNTALPEERKPENVSTDADEEEEEEDYEEYEDEE